MTPLDALQEARRRLDDATENLTFDQYLWALEDLWRGVAWLIEATATLPPSSGPSLGVDGQVPPRGSLRALIDRRTARAQPALATLVRRVESHHPSRKQGQDADAIAATVFAAWECHDTVSRSLRVVDDRVGDRLMIEKPSPGTLASPVLGRRAALKLLALGSAAPLAACSKVEREQRSLGVAPSGEPAAPAPAAPAANQTTETSVARATVGAVTPIPPMQWKTTDPFLFCAYHVDHYPEGKENLGPEPALLEGRLLGRDFEAESDWRMYHGEVVPGFPRHPHRGFETVTVVRTGLLDHSDSMGAAARYGDGDVQWLTAGGGIQHSEMFPLIKSDAPNPLDLFQIWMNLPAADKMVDPHFTMLWNEDIPRVSETDANGKAIELTLSAGEYKGHKPPSPPPNSWASKAEADVAIWSIKMEAGAVFEMPAVKPETLRSLYLHIGEGMTVETTAIGHYQRVELDGHGPVRLVAGSADIEILLLQGRPIGEPVAKRGPFVMNTQDEIKQAYADYRETQFGGWPWATNDPIHVPEQGRFARNIDGSYEEPS